MALTIRRLGHSAVVVSLLALPGCGGSTRPTCTTGSTVVISGNAPSVGGTSQLKALNTDTGQDLASSVSWVSSIPGVLTVSGSGLATGISPGSTSVHANYLAFAMVFGACISQSQTSNELLLTVTSGQASQGGMTGLAISGSAPVQGGISQLTATAAFANGTHQDVTTSVAWSSSDPSVLTISATGVATGVRGGSAISQASLPPFSAVLPLNVVVQLGRQTVSDATFSDADWQMSILLQTGTVLGTGAQSTSGGNLFRLMEHDHQTPGTMITKHVYKPLTYQPSSGSIVSIDYSEDRREERAIDHEQEFGAQIQAAIVLVQNGKDYLHMLSPVQVVNPPGFQTESVTGLVASDFRAADGTSPDFSIAGGPIQLGFWRSTTATLATPGNDGSEAFHHAIDDWTVTIVHRQRNRRRECHAPTTYMVRVRRRLERARRRRRL